MDILVRQSCGYFIRGRAKFCTGCGAHVTKFSPTALPIVAQSSLPLVVALSPDPLVLEKALIEQKFNRYSEGNGDNGDYQPISADPGYGSISIPDIPEEPTRPPEPNFAAEAESFSTSHLSNIIASAGSRQPTSKLGDAQKIFDLLGPEPEPEPEPQPIPEPEPESLQEFPPVPPAAPQVSVQSFHPGHPGTQPERSYEPPSIPGVPELPPVSQEAQAASHLQSVPQPVPQPIQPALPQSAPSFSPMAETAKPASSQGGFSPVPTTPSFEPGTENSFTPEPAKATDPQPNPFAKESFEPSPGIPLPPSSASGELPTPQDVTKSHDSGTTASPEENASQAQQVRGLLARRASNRAKHDLDDEPEQTEGKPAPWKMLTEEVEIAGRSVPKGVLIVIGIVVLFLGFRLIGPLTGVIGGAFGDLIASSKLNNLPSLSGHWRNRYQVNKKITVGKFTWSNVAPKLAAKGPIHSNISFQENSNHPTFHSRNNTSTPMVRKMASLSLARALWNFSKTADQP